MIDEIKVGQKNILFARHNGKLIYPKYASTENLVLHYDFSGRTNLDVQKGIAEDLSGNGNNGVLRNFAYTNESGYLDNALIFDGIDDFITIPEPQIDLNNFTYSEGINVFSFRGDEVATVVDGVVEIGGRNYFAKSLITIGRVYSLANGVSTRVDSSIRGTLQHIPFSWDKITISQNPEVYGLGVAFWNINKRLITSTYIMLGNSYFRGDSRSFNTPINTEFITININNVADGNIDQSEIKIEKGNKATDWTPAPEDLETTTFKPLFDKKIKSALYWNRALTDEELLQVYNTQIKRT